MLVDLEVLVGLAVTVEDVLVVGFTYGALTQYEYPVSTAQCRESHVHGVPETPLDRGLQWL